MHTRSLGLSALLITLTTTIAAADLVVEHHETVGIDGRDWDSSVSGATTIDAVHRQVLLRFAETFSQPIPGLRAGIK